MSKDNFSYPELSIDVAGAGGRDTTEDQLSFRVPGPDSDPDSGKHYSIHNHIQLQPEGIETVAATLGIKKSGKPDFCFVRLPEGSSGAAVFTRSVCPSVTILRGRTILQSSRLRALAVNSGNANVFTPTGQQDIDTTAQVFSKEFGVPEREILICSTGVIGVKLAVEKFVEGVPGQSKRLKPGNLAAAASAILTTDLGPKVACFQHAGFTLSGMAKGAGMIEPNMATMLVYFFTDAKLAQGELQQILEASCADSFNRISIDSDMSTSDTVALFSTQQVSLSQGEKAVFAAALRAMSVKLARDIVSQGEGVSKIIECVVSSDKSMGFSRDVAKLIINSPLVKAAVHGSDPNWGRIVAAIGKARLESHLSPESIRISLMGIPVYDQGKELGTDLKQVRGSMKAASRIPMSVEIGTPNFAVRCWGCDLTEEYVTYNSDYTS